MTTPDPVHLQIDDGVAQITLNRPEAGNSLTVPLCHRLAAAIRAAADDATVRAVVLAGEGDRFCAGGDVRAMQAATDRAAFVRDLVEAAHGAVRELARLEVPVLCAVQGAAAGAGLSLVLLSDLVVASPEARFTTAYAAIGLSPDCGLSWLLPRAIGTQRALDWTLRPRAASAPQALDLGIITAVVDGSPRETALAWARDLVAQAPTAAGNVRTLIRSSYGTGFEEHLDREAEAIVRAAASPEAGRLISAFGAAPTGQN